MHVPEWPMDYSTTTKKGAEWPTETSGACVRARARVCVCRSHCSVFFPTLCVSHSSLSHSILIPN